VDHLGYAVARNGRDPVSRLSARDDRLSRAGPKVPLAAGGGAAGDEAKEGVGWGGVWAVRAGLKGAACSAKPGDVSTVVRETPAASLVITRELRSLERQRSEERSEPREPSGQGLSRCC
jgi:hypothetical protein